jgi:hypothetical protein
MLKGLLRTAAMLALAGNPQAAWADALPAAEDYALKARVLRVIGGYITGPPRQASGSAQAFLIGVLGKSPFGPHLEEACRGRAVHARPIRLAYQEDAGGLLGCDLVFICASERTRLPRWLALFKGRPVFLLGDTPGFAAQGVMLTMLLEGGTLTLEANLKAARAAGFEVNASFLALSKDKLRIIDPS